MGKKSRLKKERREGQDEIAVPSKSSRPFDYTVLLKSLPFILSLTIFIVGITLRASQLGIIAEERSPDEQVYARQALTIVQEGLNGTKGLVEEHLENKDLWIYPPPTRIGYIYLLAGAMNITHMTDERAGSYLSLVCSIMILTLVVLIGLRFFNPWITVFGLFLMCVSPMDLAIARRCWSDEAFALLGLLMTYICCEIMRKPKPVLYLSFWIISGYFLLMKELAMAFYGLYVIWLVWSAIFREKSYKKGIALIVMSLVAAVISYLLIFSVAGGMAKVLSLLRNVKESIPLNQYALDYQTGPWNNFFRSIWILSPFSISAAVIGIMVVLFRKYLSGPLTDIFVNNSAVYTGLTYCTIAFFWMVMLIPHSQNVRYISVIYAPICLVGGLGLWYMVCAARYFLKNISLYLIIFLALSGLVIVGINDYKNFERIFINAGIRDLSSRLILENSRH